MLSTSDPQILLEEAEEEEDNTFQIGEPTPDEDSSPGAEESRQWLDETNGAHDGTSPVYGSGNEEEFSNPWGSSR